MSAPIPMPVPVPYLSSLINPIQASSPGHAPQHPLDSATTSNMSPSNHSAHSSAYALPSTAATSPVSNFTHGFGGPGLLANQAVNPNSTTRILLLSEFSKELKTRDIQLVFAEWEDERGGFKIKWVDDTSCLIVFADPGVAKRAFLSVLSNPPSSLTNVHGDGAGRVAKLRAYNGPDVTHILASVQNRPRSRSNASQSLHSRGSSIASNSGGLGRRPSMGTIAARNRSSLSAASGVGMRGSLPPSSASTATSVNPLVQAQVQELIDHVTTTHSNGPSSTSFGPTAASRPSTASSDVPEQASSAAPSAASALRPRIDDAGKRFIAAGLSKPNSTISHIPINELDESSNAATYSLANLTIEEEATTPTAASH